MSIPAGGPGACKATSLINIMSVGNGPMHATFLGPDLIDTGVRQFAKGTVTRDAQGRITNYKVAPGDALYAIGDRFCLYDPSALALLAHRTSGAIQPGDILDMLPDPKAAVTE